MWHRQSIQIIFMPIHKIWWFFFWVIIFMYLLLPFAHRWIKGNIPPIIPFSAINFVWISIDSSGLTFVFCRTVCHDNLGAERNWAGSGSYVSMHLFWKFSNTSQQWCIAVKVQIMIFIYVFYFKIFPNSLVHL